MTSSTGKALLVLLSTIFLLTAFGHSSLHADDSADQRAFAVKARLKAGQSASDSRLKFSFPAELKIFYARRGFKPAWTGEEGVLPVGTYLMDALQNAVRHGLRPEDYHLARLQSLISLEERSDSGNRSEGMAELDLFMTDAFFLYASHLASGKCDPIKLKSHWYIPRRTTPDLTRVLEKALARGTVVASLENLAPSNPAYARLMEALQRYREIAGKGDWPILPAGPALKEGDRSDAIPLLRERLNLPSSPPFWEYIENNGREYLFDESLVQAVRAFQQRHGLPTDGVVGPETIEMLNVPAADRVRQIEVNLERLRWLPDSFENPRVVVNIPQFELRFIRNGRIEFAGRIVVGKGATNTPVFRSRITHFILNPYWYVPSGIAAEEILPQIRKSPEYLIWENMKILSYSKNAIKEVPLWTINWEKMTPRTFHYQIRQDPGARNPLGRIKFMFPNPFDVYLHDTPARNLFEKTQRSFSHGCIRVENPLELAAELIPGKSEKELQSEVETGRRKQINLPKAIEIYVLYLTAWVNADGQVQFRSDIYNHDALLQEALKKTEPLSQDFS